MGKIGRKRTKPELDDDDDDEWTLPPNEFGCVTPLDGKPSKEERRAMKLKQPIGFVHFPDTDTPKRKARRKKV